MKTYKRTKRRTAPKTTIKTIRKIVKQTVKQNIEAKYIVYENVFSIPHDGNVAGYSIIEPLSVNRSGWVGLYDGGTDCHSLLGTDCRLQSVDLCYSIHMSPLSPPGTSIACRILLAYDNEPARNSSYVSNLALYSGSANWDDLILRTSQITSPYYGVPLGHRGSNRFTVIYDKIHNLSDSGEQHCTVQRKVPLHNKKLEFTTTSIIGTPYPMTANLLLFAIYTGSSTEVDPAMAVNTRVWFNDA